MKRITFIFAILLSLIAMSSCEDRNVRELKNYVAAANAECPENIGIAGDLLSVKYQEEENRVLLYLSVNEEIGASLFLKKNKKIMLNQFRLIFAEDKSDPMLEYMVNAKASVMLICKSSSSGKTIKFELPYEELKDIKGTSMSQSEIQRLIVENKIDIENSKCPYKVENGVTATKVALEDGKIRWYFEVDESLVDMRELKRHEESMKDDVIEWFESMKLDQTVQNELRNLVDQNIGYDYRYYGNKSNRHIDIAFTAEELSKYIVK